MKKINLMSSDRYSGCYDGDFDRWDVYVSANEAEPIPVNVSISQDGVAYWNCYLVAAKYLKKQNIFQLTYKEYKMTDKKYTKGDCYAICEFLSWLIQDYRTEIRTIADELGYPQDSMIKLLERLHNDVDSVIGQEQDERDYTEQMADIMQIVHVPGHDDYKGDK